MHLLDLVILASGLPLLIAAKSLGSTIASHSSLSILHDVLRYHNLIDDLNAAQNATYFAPNNAALKYLADFGINLTTADPDIAKALIFYSLIDGRHSSDSIISNDDVQLVHSALYPPLFTNVSDGQALKLTKSTIGSHPKVVLETGLQILTQVEEPDIQFDHGLLHTPGTNMVLPHNVSETCRLGQLSEFLRLVRASGIEAEVNSLADMTLFIPHDAAVSRTNPLLEGLKPAELAAVIRSHAVAGKVIYHDKAVDQVLEVETVGGNTLQIHSAGQGEMFVNNINIVRSDLLLYGGVAHIIDGVLIPELDDSVSCGVTPETVPLAGGITVPAKISKWIPSKRNGIIVVIIALFAIGSIPAKFCWRRRRHYRQQLVLNNASSEALLGEYKRYGLGEM